MNKDNTAVELAASRAEGREHALPTGRPLRPAFQKFVGHFNACGVCKRSAKLCATGQGLLAESGEEGRRLKESLGIRTERGLESPAGGGAGSQEGGA